MRSIEEAVRVHGDMVYRLAMANLRSVSDAEDVFQEVFLRLAQHEAPFESKEHEKAWLIRVTVNCARSLWRQWKRRITAQAAGCTLYGEFITCECLITGSWSVTFSLAETP